MTESRLTFLCTLSRHKEPLQNMNKATTRNYRSLSAVDPGAKNLGLPLGTGITRRHDEAQRESIVSAREIREVDTRVHILFPPVDASGGQRSSSGAETRSKRRLLTCWAHCPRDNLVKVTNRSPLFGARRLYARCRGRGPFCHN